MNASEQKMLSLIESYSGLTVNDAHRNFMNIYVNQRINELGLQLEDFCTLIQNDRTEMEKLINEAAINETYFFREEQQFDFLTEHFIPHLQSNIVRIWSAACSTGEEALSLYALVKAMGFTPEIYATDIDTDAMNVLKKGIYSSNSFRPDGSKYMVLLDKIGKRDDSTFVIDSDVKENIKLSQFNLSSGTDLPVLNESIDIIFLRNVFIYFDMDLRNRIIKRLCPALKEGGVLFLSINEVASIECPKDLPLVKEHKGSVYYFRKVSMEEKNKKLSEKKQCGKKEVRTASRKTAAISPASSAIRAKSSGPQTFPAARQTSSGKQTLPAAQKSQFASPDHIQKLYKEIQTLLEAGKTDEAEKVLKESSFRAQEKEFMHYLGALIEDAKGRYTEAYSGFYRARVANPSFWPAHFKSATVLMQQNRESEAKKEFSVCAKLLRDYIKSSKTCYNFMTEEFSPAYFLELCENMIRKK